MTSISTYTVEHYQFNCAEDSVGEGAVMLLVKTTGSTDTIAKAVLIDCGYAGNSVVRLKDLLARLQTRFGGKVKFDAVSISHWDKDHYWGFSHFLNDETTTWTELGDPKTLTCDWFKYEVVNKAPVPQTHFFCQEWQTKVHDKLRIGDPLSKDGLVGISVVTTKYGLVGNVMLGHVKTEHVLGANLFTQKSLGVSSESITALGDLLAKNAPDTGLPGLYVVGVNDLGLGKATGDPEVVGSVSSEKQAGDPEVLHSKNSRIAILNAKSILLLLVWDFGNGPIAMMYTGGDAEFRQEERLASWLKQPVWVVKAGHHGSRIGTSTNFWDVVKPQLYIISAGRLHGHPVAEIVFYLDAYFSRLDPKVSTARVWSVCFPYYLGLVKNDAGAIVHMVTKYMVPDRFEDSTDEGIRNFLQALRGYYTDKAWNAGSTELQQLRADFKADANGKVASLTQRIRNLWDKWSGVPHNYFPFGSCNIQDFRTSASMIAESIFVRFDRNGPVARLVNSEDTPSYMTLSEDDSGGATRAEEEPSSKPSITIPEEQPRLDAKRIVVKLAGEIVLNVEAAKWLSSEETAEEDEDELRYTHDPDPSIWNVTASPVIASTGNPDFPWEFQAIFPFFLPNQQVQGALYAIEDSSEDQFLRQMDSQIVILSESTTLTSSDMVWSSNTDPADDFTHWLSQQFPKGGNASITLHGVGKAVDSFLITLQPFGGLTNVLQLAYTSDNSVIQKAFSVSNDILQMIIDEKGFFNATCELVLALDPDSTQTQNLGDTFTFKDMCDLAELDMPAWFSYYDIVTTTPLKFQTQPSPTNPAVNIINAIWFLPGSRYSTILRLHAMEDSQTAAEVNFGMRRQMLSKLLPNCVADSPLYVISKTTEKRTVVNPGTEGLGTTSPTGVPDQDPSAPITTPLEDGETSSVQIITNGSLVIQAAIQFYEGSVAPPSVDRSKGYWDAFMKLGNNSVSLVLRWNGQEDPLANFLTWIEARLGVQDVFKDFQDLLNSAGALQLRQVRFTIDLSNDTPAFNSFSLDFEADLSWGAVIPTQVVPFLLSFSWERFTPTGDPLLRFRGSMWPTPMTAEQTAFYNLSPDSPVTPPLLPTANNASTLFSILALPGIAQLSEAMGQIPSWLPTSFSSLALDITTQSISFSGTMVCTPPTNDTSPTFPLTEVSLSASWAFVGTQPPSLGFRIVAFLPNNYSIDHPETDTTINPEITNPTRMLCSVDYAGGVWALTAEGEDLFGTHLYSLFPPTGDHDTVTRLLEEITISRFSLSYTYGGDFGTMFTASGIVCFADTIDLSLDFTWDSAKPSTAQWSFSAVLATENMGPNGYQVTLGSILSTVCHTLEDLLPKFVQDLSVTITSDDSLALEIAQDDQNDTMICSITATTQDFEFSFVQILKKNSTTVPKRMLRFTVNGLPGITGIPLISELQQPFDRMDFLWISDDFKFTEVTSLNTAVFTSDPIAFVDPNTQKSTQPKKQDRGNQGNDPDPVVMTAGCHFVVIDDSGGSPSVVLDYDFQDEPPAPDPGLSAATPTTMVIRDSTDPSPSANDNDTKSATYKAKFGPLTLYSIGLGYKDGNLNISIDASVSLGPITAMFDGFVLSIPVSQVQNITDVDVSLKGIGLSFDNSPLILSGSLIELGPDSWEGGITIAYDPYVFIAGGLYQHVPVPDSSPAKTFPTVFVFARLDGPLVELEFASISGITGGFGYNSAMTMPNVTNVTSFPFLKGSLESDPLAVLEDFLTPVPTLWFSPGDGDIWIAAGLTCSAFQVLSIEAVATLALNPDLVLGIFANCAAKVPLTASTDDSDLFVLVELGVVTVMDPSRGLFYSEGQLTPRSFVLDRSCHLSGGFAFCYWFQGSGHNGDWVFTVGGYHSAFQVPSHYPNPPRLGISWQFDPMVSISGTAYFAITPKACMGGGSLEISYNLGVLDAYFDAWADFLINFRPFSFVGDVGVSIGIDFSIPLFFFTLYFHVHFGASVHLWGPPVAGYVFVDWDIVSFTISFGDSNPANDALTWELMWQLLQQVGSASGNQAVGRQPHVFASTGGLTTAKDAPIKVTAEDADNWAVLRGSFGFTVKTLFPITLVTYTYASELVKETLFVKEKFNGEPTYVKPMHVTDQEAVSSELQVDIAPTNGGDNALFQMSPIIELVPMALWGAYDPNSDPNTGKSASDLLNPSESTVAQLMGVMFQTMPTLAPDTILPFQVIAACSYPVFLADEVPSIPIPPKSPFLDAWLPDLNGGSSQLDWQNPKYTGSDVLSQWMLILDSGKKDGPYSREYADVKTDLPIHALTDQWSDCFPVPPFLSKGSGI